MSEQRSVKIRVRRTPRFGVFLTIGGLAGVIASLITVGSGAGGEDYTVFTSLSYFATVFVVGGVTLGAVTSLIVEWAFRRRASETRVTGTYAAVGGNPDAAEPARSDDTEAVAVDAADDAEPDDTNDTNDTDDAESDGERNGSGDGHMSVGH